MAVIYVLLPVALLLAVCFVALFVWATRDGQFDDVRTPQLRVLFDDDDADESAETRRTASGPKKECS
jgi:cbb3-type cytochrome oxidase maturation protein